MAKTAPTKASVKAHLDAIADEGLRRDAKRLDRTLRDATGERPVMWGDAMVGYGRYSYAYASGTKGDWPRIAFAARKTGLVLYLMPEFPARSALLKKVGKVKVGKSCAYLPALSELDEAALRVLIDATLAEMDELYPRSA